MVIKSNTLGKLQKIKNGNVFDSPLIFLRELLQNSQRSKAKKISFLVDEDMLICQDDGCGCKNPENVFTLDLSDWESTTEGYGIGFWACLAVPDIKMISVQSKSWHCTVDAEKLFATGDLTVKQEKVENKEGFRVVLQSEWFREHYDDIEIYIFDIAKYLPLDVYINELRAPHYDIFDSFQPDTYFKVYDNRFFKAKLEINPDYYDDTDMYYEKRLVCRNSYPFVKGVIEIKHGKLTLKEPDRTSYSRDDLYYRFMEKLNDCIKDLYKSYATEYGVDDEEYSSALLKWLEFKDYERFLRFDSDDIQLVKPKKAVNGGTKVEPEEEPKAAPAKEINTSDYKKENEQVVQAFNNSAKATAASTAAPQTYSFGSIKRDNGLRDKIKKMKNAVWVRKCEVSTYEDDIQVAKYKGLNVIVAKNDVYANALGEYGIVHICDLRRHFKEVYVKSDIELKNGKEEAFIALIQPICKRFKLPLDTFLICDLAIESRFEVNGEIVQKRTIKNKKDEILIYGAAGGGHIYLDRRALGLNRFGLRKGNTIVGIHETKAILANVNTIAHELAHLRNGTKDNTPEHYQTEISYQRAIINLFL